MKQICAYCGSQAGRKIEAKRLAENLVKRQRSLLYGCARIEQFTLSACNNLWLCADSSERRLDHKDKAVPVASTPVLTRYER